MMSKTQTMKQAVKGPKINENGKNEHKNNDGLLAWDRHIKYVAWI